MWRLHLPSQQAVVQIDGVTRWEAGDPYPNLPYWTPDPASYFPLPENRWLLTPYKKTVFGQPGERKSLALQVHNNSQQTKTVKLDLEFPDGEWPARLNIEQVELPPKKHAAVTVDFTVPPEGETRICHVRATPLENAEFSTYSTLTVKADTAPATRPLKMPIVLKPYAHENEQFGYLPDYPVESQVYFGMGNRPFMRMGNGITTLRDGKWTAGELRRHPKESTPFLGRTFTLFAIHENRV